MLMLMIIHHKLGFSPKKTGKIWEFSRIYREIQSFFFNRSEALIICKRDDDDISY